MKFLYNPIRRMTVPVLDDVLITQLFGNDPIATQDTWYGNKLVKKGEHVYKILANQSGHNGIDIMCNKGTPIYAPADGWIIEQVAKDTGYGLRISIRHEVLVNGVTHYFFTVYGHMEKLEIDKNIGWNWNSKVYPVKMGQVIGYVDSTGYSTGDHLHWSLYPVLQNGNKLFPNNGFGGAVDPFEHSFKLDVPNMIGYKIVGDATTYVDVQGKLVPIADWAAFLSLGGSTESVIDLTAEQFSKFTKVDSVLFKKK